MTAERIALDSNVLVYAVDSGAGMRHEIAVELIAATALVNCLLAGQAIAEFVRATTRKGHLPRETAARKAVELRTIFPIVMADVSALDRAIETARLGRYSIWDALMLATLEQAGCTLLLSEDMQDGARFGGLTILNPFKGRKLPRRAAAALGLR